MSENVSFIRGNIFTSKAQSLVNTVNCVGVMGAGIALEYKYRYPEMFARYAEFCKAGRIQIGVLYVYDVPQTVRKVINFPTKRDWKHPSKMEYLERGLDKFIETYKSKGITSVAFPLLGAQNGGLDPVRVRGLMTERLGCADIPVEIYEYTPNAKDDLFEPFLEGIIYNRKEFKSSTGLKDAVIDRLREAVSVGEFNSLIQLEKVKGIGEEAIKASFQFAMRVGEGRIKEQTLFKAGIENIVQEEQASYGLNNTLLGEAASGELLGKVDTTVVGEKSSPKSTKPRKAGGKARKSKKSTPLTLGEKQLMTDLPAEIIENIESGNEDVTIRQLKAYASGMNLKAKKFVADRYFAASAPSK